MLMKITESNAMGTRSDETGRYVSSGIDKNVQDGIL